MPEIRTFFRHCPACGRHFEIRVVKKELEEEDSQVGEMSRVGMSTMPGMPGLAMRGAPTPLILEQKGNEAMLVEEKEFNYTYRCKHCGHEWSEIHEVVKDEPAPKDYTGD